MSDTLTVNKICLGLQGAGICAGHPRSFNRVSLPGAVRPTLNLAGDAAASGPALP